MATTMKLIGKVSLGADAANIEFTSIPDTYTDLCLQFSGRSDYTGSTYDFVKWTYNANTSGYTSRLLYSLGTTTYSGAEASVSYAVSYGGLATATASTFGNCELYIPNYAGSTNKSASSSFVGEANTAGNAIISAGAHVWANTAAITSIKLFPYYGSNWKSGTTGYLYGITKA